MSDVIPGFDVEAERRRLEICVREPIRTPGRIQSHGRLLGVDPATGFITLASENASEWLGRPLIELSPELAATYTSASAIDPRRVVIGGAVFDAIVNMRGGLAIIELELVDSALEYSRISVVGAIQRLSTITDPGTLRAEAARELRSITGFDRVMIYRFFEDDHGEVAAEARADDTESYLGLQFPASDIPAQARQLYLTKLSRAIVSTEDQGSPLLALDKNAAEVDLSAAELRAVSPHHLQFMRNMGQASTVSFSLVANGQLVGMITCAHRTERRLPVLLRRSLEVLANLVSLQLANMERIAGLVHSLEVLEQRAALLAPLFASDDLAAALLDGERTVLDLVKADGVILRFGESVRTGGDVPPADSIRPLLDAADCTPLVTNTLAADRPDLAALAPGFAGMLVVPFADADECLIFLRREVTRHINWLGDQRAGNRLEPLSPRLSFTSWQESVSGTSLPWEEVAREAADLGVELHGAMVRRSDARLAALAMRDPLTGAHNRRYLIKQLDEVAPSSAGRAMLFVDLDEFKAVNDTHGHDVGDAVLVEVSRRLEASARGDDTVVRLGGDEFVMLCSDVTPEAAMAIAHRIVAALAEPMRIGELELVVTGSCGMSPIEPGSAGSVALEQADAAMYRAKRSGRNRASD